MNKIFFFCTFFLSLFSLDLMSQNLTKPHVLGPNNLQVNSFTGGLNYERKDLYIPGRGLSIECIFNYNSSKRGTNSEYGRGWSFSYNLRYRLDSLDVIIERADGRKDKFLYKGNVYISPKGVFDTLIKDQQGQFKLVTKNKIEYFFGNSTHRKLTKLKDLNGNEITLTYADTLLKLIKDAGSHLVTLDWSNNKLTSIKYVNKNIERFILYNYDEKGNLIRYTDQLGKFEEYKYDEYDRMASMFDKNGYPVVIEYNASSAVVNLISCVGNQKITYKPEVNKTFVIEQYNGNSEISTYVYDPEGRIAEQFGSCCGFVSKFKYDNDNNICENIDGNGNKVVSKFDISGNKLFESDALNNVTSYTYDLTSNKVTSITDKNKNKTSYVYDEKSNLVRIIKPLNIVEEYEYDEFGNKISHKNGNSHITLFAYDSNGYLINETDALGKSIVREYDDIGNLVFEQDKNGYVTRFEYDAMNRVVKIIDPNSGERNFEYDGKGNKISEKDPNDRLLTMAYDPLDRVIEIRKPSGNTTSYEYDLRGNVIKKIDGKGLIYSYQYNQRNQKIKEIDPMGGILNLEYDSNGNLIKFMDKKGQSTTFNYDKLNRVVKTTNAIGYARQFSYDNNGNKIKEIDEDGNETRYEFDALNRLTKEIDPSGGTLFYSYDKNNNLISFTNKNNYKHQYVYDFVDRQTEVIDPLNFKQIKKYDSNGNIISISDKNGNEMKYSYDVLNRIISMTLANGEIIKYSYDMTSNPRVIELSNGAILEYEYDEDVREISIKDNHGLLYSKEYDNNDNVTKKTDGNGNYLLYSYDKLNRNTEIIDAANKKQIVEYDLNSNRISTIDRNGNKRHFSYDNANRLISSTNSLNEKNSVMYDKVGNPVKLTDAKGVVTTYEYDVLQRLVSIGYPNGEQTLFNYDKNGNLISKKMNNGALNYFYFDPLDRLIKRKYSDGKEDVFTFDPNGNILSALNTSASIYFTYDNNNRLLSEKLNGKTTEISYDTENRKRKLKYPNGKTIEEEMDFRSHIISLKDSLQALVTLNYDLGNRLSSINYFNGVQSNFHYNGRDLITSIEHKKNSPFVLYEYKHDNERNVLSEEQPLNLNMSKVYSYDSEYQLLSYKEGVLIQDEITAPVQETKFNFDENGNRESEIVNNNVINYLSNVSNEYSVVGNSSYSYDKNGNLTSNGACNFLYDSEGRLTKFTRQGLIAIYEYDAIGRRVKKIINDTTIHFYFDGQNIIEEDNTYSGKIVNYVYANAWVDQALIEIDSDSIYFLHHNSIGSIVAITNSQADVVERYEYDPFGKPVFINSNNSVSYASLVNNPLLFAGRYYDYESGQYYIRLRHYDPITGRFLSPDPLGPKDDINLYVYSMNNPVNLFDYSGATAIAIGAGLVLAPSLPAIAVSALVAAGIIITVEGVSYIYKSYQEVLDEANSRGIELTLAGYLNLAAVRHCMNLYDRYKSICSDLNGLSCSKCEKPCSTYVEKINILERCKSARLDYLNFGCDNFIKTFADHAGEVVNIQNRINKCLESYLHCQSDETKSKNKCNPKSCNP